MGNRGRLIAPGGLRDEFAGEADDGQPIAEPLAGLAAQYGLRPSSARPSLSSYLARVWQRRHFVFAYATARNVSMYTEARLGQLWQVLTPLLNLAVGPGVLVRRVLRGQAASQRAGDLPVGNAVQPDAAR
jgi:teichoic acid transport system permease protein